MGRSVDEMDLLREILEAVQSTEQRVENLQRELNSEMETLNKKIDLLHQQTNYINQRIGSLTKWVQSGFTETNHFIQSTQELADRFQEVAATLENRISLYEGDSFQMKKEIQDLRKQIAILKKEHK